MTQVDRIQFINSGYRSIPDGPIMIISETVEKVQKANSRNFSIVKIQRFKSHRKSIKGES